MTFDRSVSMIFSNLEEDHDDKHHLVEGPSVPSTPTQTSSGSSYSILEEDNQETNNSGGPSYRYLFIYSEKVAVLCLF